MRFFFILSGLLLLIAGTASAQGSYFANSCSYADVNDCVNGSGANTCHAGSSGGTQGTHTVVNGDTVNLPACTSITWSSSLIGPSGVAFTIVGNGTPNTTTGTTGASASCSNTQITDSASSYLIGMTPNYASVGSSILSRVSCIDVIRGTTNSNPIQITGTCTSSGCPNFRLDNVTAGDAWSQSGNPDATFLLIFDVFGVADHNTVGAGSPTGNGVVLVNSNYPSFDGVGLWGDNSWAVGYTFGSSQAIYLENNSFDGAFGTDADNGNGGGGRVVCRFNSATSLPNVSFCGGHGTETTGRPRGIVAGEIYENSISSSTNLSAVGGFRSGTSYVWANSISATSLSHVTTLNDYRLFRPVPFGYCNGTSPYDVNDGYATVQTGLSVSSFSSPTVTFSGTPFTANAYAFSTSSPGANLYILFDNGSGDIATIVSNTASALTISGPLDGTGSPLLTGSGFASGHSVTIYSATLYTAGTNTGTTGSNTLQVSGTPWTTNQWVGYNVTDVTSGNSYQIGANTSNTLTYYTAPSSYSGSGGGWTWTNGDSFAIMRATQCLDQGSVTGGSLLSGTVPAKPSSAQTRNVSYEWADTGNTANNGIYGIDSLNLQANRDYYGEVSQSAQSSPTSPFNGTTGTGYGTLANQPTTCTTGVGYFATNQGTWNQSGGNNPVSYSGQGELYICTATNTWTLSYTPYTYPHPLIAGGGSTSPPATTPGILAIVNGGHR